MNLSCVTLTVPGTTANIGPGFDCLGAALTLYNKFKFTLVDDPTLAIAVTGTEAHKVETDESNLLYQAFLKFYQYIDVKPPSVKIEIQLGVPLARGLGSSATAIVGGLVAANVLAGETLNQQQVMELAVAIEGHPDNVVPALLGGCRLAASTIEQKGWEICEIPWCKEIVPIVAIPDFELSTKQARGVLPTQVSRADAIFNMAHLGLLLRALETGQEDWLRCALQDKLHQNYRKILIKAYENVQSAAIEAGAYGMVISGAGPTLLALSDTANSNAVASAMTTAWNQQGVKCVVLPLSVDDKGTKIVKE